MDDIVLTAPQKRWLALATVVALAVGTVFLTPYISLILLSAVIAYLFNPTYQLLTLKFGKPGLAAMLTLIISMLVVIIPLVIVILLTVWQLEILLADLDSKAVSQDINAALVHILESVNQFFSSIGMSLQISAAQVAEGAQRVLETASKNILSFLTSSIGNFFDFFTLLILYIFVFTNMLRHQKTISRTISKLNILGDDLGKLYAQRIGAMTKATIRGQFVIALAQGFASAVGLYIAGVHDLFFFALLIFTALSIIPLGAGIVTMPIGVVMILLGNIWGGIFLIAWHLLVVTNLDNILRPRLVPREAQLNSALMMLAVFAGLAHFGFFGIVLGPVIMIVAITTIQVFLAVYHNVSAPKPKNAQRAASRLKRLWQRGKHIVSRQPSST